MACIASAKPAAVVAPRGLASSGLRPVPAAFSKPSMDQKFAAVQRSAKAQRRSTVAPQALSGVEIAQLAESEAGFIGGVAGVMFAITLVGLAVGFIILRVESLAEEGKI